ncbi:MAG: pseudouridine synthase [Crocinitomicaceae bacterium]|nr:pseudouridine synthase [Crocinitomicaceae bacterium]
MLEVLYHDEFFIAINKPHGLLVHQSPIARNAEEFAVQLLRDQLGKRVNPVHRLDRKTAGVLFFAFEKETTRLMQQLFENKQVVKKYIALIRGYAPPEMTINHPLINDKGVTQEAITYFKTIQQFELALPHGKHATSRYSLVEATLETGRMHQLRKHFAHIFHPIIGDRPHGCNKQNKLWLENFQMNTMLLHAESVEFVHPVSNEKVFVSAEKSREFNRVLKILKGRD